MNSSSKSNESSQSPVHDALAHGTPVVKTASGAIVEKRRALLPGTLEQEEAARSFATARDEASFKVLFAGAQKPAAAGVRRMGFYADDAREMVRLARASIWNERDRYPGQTYAQFVAYVITLAHSEAVERCDRFRSGARSIILMESERCLAQEAVDPGASPEEHAAAHAAYGRLSPEAQKVVRMHTEGWSYRTIGVAIGCTSKCAKEIYRSAIERMREMLK